jgi:hypothetical protein
MKVVGKKGEVPIILHYTFALKPLMGKHQDFYHLLIVMGAARHIPNFKNVARLPEF